MHLKIIAWLSIDTAWIQNKETHKFVLKQYHRVTRHVASTMLMDAATKTQRRIDGAGTSETVLYLGLELESWFRRTCKLSQPFSVIVLLFWLFPNLYKRRLTRQLTNLNSRESSRLRDGSDKRTGSKRALLITSSRAWMQRDWGLLLWNSWLTKRDSEIRKQGSWAKQSAGHGFNNLVLVHEWSGERGCI